MDVCGNRVNHADTMLGIAQEDNTGIGGEPLIGRLDFDTAVELGLKKVNLGFTHRVIQSVLKGCS